MDELEEGGRAMGWGELTGFVSMGCEKELLLWLDGDADGGANGE